MHAHVTVGVAPVTRQTPSRVVFCALDGPVRVLIEADSEDDVRYLCHEMNFEFICVCR
jgi:hypothetical protein